MAIRTDPNPGRGDRRTTLGSLARLESLSRYDLALLLIPLAFLCSFVLGSMFPVPTSASLVGASLFGAAVVTDVYFRNPPTVR